MITFLTALALFCTTYAPAQPPAPVTVQHGRAVMYSPLVMERVYRVRVKQGLAPAGWRGGLISRPSCATIGRIYQVSFRNPRTGAYSASMPMLQVDCSAPKDVARHIREGLIVESDYNTALQTGWAWYGHTQAIVEWRN